jgi:uncharacterized RDD family membrane protein YckC
VRDASPGQTPMQAVPANVSKELQPFHVASSTKRFINLLVDFVGCSLFMLAVTVSLVMLAKCTSVRSLVLTLMAYSEFRQSFAVVKVVLYYVIQEYFFGQTLGKFLTGTIVISADGAKPSVGQIFGRTFGRFIPFEPFSYLFGGSHPIGWHDSLSKTRVVEKARTPNSKAEAPRPKP